MRAGLANSIRFDPADPHASLSGLPEAPGIFALCAADPAAEPYLSKTPNLRRRLMRFLRGPKSGVGQSEPPLTRRLQLAHMVDHIEYSVTGSEFESSLCLYEASLRAFGERAQKRLRLRPPAFLADVARQRLSARLCHLQNQQDGGQRSFWPVPLASSGRAVCG